MRKKIYTEICEHVKPVFHYFLLEKFPIPGIWFERRLAYVNSVATTSMVGYVLGLGDRHTQNILIDEQTAEVVHIDFGKIPTYTRSKEMITFRIRCYCSVQALPLSRARFKRLPKRCRFA